MIQKMIPLLAISILLAISVKSQTEGCCEFSRCNFEKLEISQQLLTMASQIQSQVITSGKLNGCSTSSSNTTPTSTTIFEPPTTSRSTTTTSETPTSSTTTTTSEPPTPTTTTSEPPTPTTTTPTTTPTMTTTTTGPTITRLVIYGNPGNFTYAKNLCFNTVVKRKMLTIDTRTEWESEVKYKLRQERGYTSPYSWSDTQFYWVDGSLVGGIWSWGNLTPVDLTFIPVKLWSGSTKADNQTALMLVYERPVDDIYLSPVDPALIRFPYDPKIAGQIEPFCEKETS